MIQDRKKYIDDLSSQLKDWDNRILKLQIKIQTLRNGSKEKYQKLVEDLDNEREQLYVKLLELKNTGKESWGDLSKRIEEIWNDMKKTYSHIAIKFR